MKQSQIILPAVLALTEAATFLVPTQLRGSFKAIGTTTHLLTDNSRTDPYDPKHRKRQILISFYYPTSSSHSKPSVYGPPAFLRATEEDYGVPSGTLDSINVRAETNAPFNTAAADLPLIIFSPGMGIATNVYASMTAGLASHGYVIAAINHAYDASILEYPDGTLVPSANITDAGVDDLTRVRTADAKFILDEITKKGAQGDFIPGCAPKPKSGGHCTCYSSTNVAMYGHSLGGATSADLMLTDKRIKAGMNMDGRFVNEAAETKQAKLRGPFMIMQGSEHNRTTETTFPIFWDAHKKDGVFLREVGFKGYQHLTYTDLPILVDGNGFRAIFPPGELDQLIGTINGFRAEEINDAFHANFFDLALKGKKATVIEGPTKDIPEAIFEN